MKILHTADIHLGDLTGPVRDGKNARRQDTIACMKYIAQRAATETPNVTIIAGDLPGGRLGRHRDHLHGLHRVSNYLRRQEPRRET